MPIRWTAAADQILLVKILETHDLAVDTVRVAEAWPNVSFSWRCRGPTNPRAIKERLAKIKEMARQTAKNGTHENPSPPTKRPRASKSSKSAGVTKSSRGRKRKRTPKDEPVEPLPIETALPETDAVEAEPTVQASAGEASAEPESLPDYTDERTKLQDDVADDNETGAEQDIEEPEPEYFDDNA
ncbi:hypothetical protein N7532_004677 [Penicillium argentinense]|uniref:Uncharacterized protein n=1 Tax=Penicillium argentinense TaxID=1131581 RepID=A0A9W9FPW7_9EURO|nr:uncharacterized protein N7532_004677 [Penicillium argentinense]KAJ5104148.1 hypothetical protein N7532_004677 [Penicillium argentinense]